MNNIIPRALPELIDEVDEVLAMVPKLLFKTVLGPEAYKDSRCENHFLKVLEEIQATSKD